MRKATGKDHAQINLDIWGDDDWMDLTPPAQHLYFVLWTSPELSYCGCGPWHPGKIAAKARGWTPAAVEAAAVELSAELFVIIDTTTEEFDLRSWIKHDGLWRSPNMAVSMANARAALASRTLRGVVVHEVSKIKARNLAEADAENPVSNSWQRDAVKNLLSQKAIDPASLPRFTPTLTPPATPALTPAATPHPTPPPTLNGGVRVNPSANPGPTPAPAPAPFLHLHNGGYVSPEGHQPNDPDPNHPPPRYCPEHMPDGGDRTTPCGACGAAGSRLRDWQTAQRRNAAEAHSADLRQAAADRAAAIANCPLGCHDNDGYRPNGTVCDHFDRTDTAAKGRAMVQAALAKGADDA